MLIEIHNFMDFSKRTQIISSIHCDQLDQLIINPIQNTPNGVSNERCELIGIEGIYSQQHTKIINNRKQALKFYDHALTRFLIAKDLNHPNIIKLLYFKKEEIGENDFHFDIIKENLDGSDMLSYLRNSKFISNQGKIAFVKSAAFELLTGILYLHENNIVN